MKLSPLVLATALSACATAPQVIHHVGLLSQFGPIVDASDEEHANRTLESGSEDLPEAWTNAHGYRFIVTPTRTFKKGDEDCRDFTAVNGPRTVKQSACRRDDGTWFSL